MAYIPKVERIEESQCSVCSHKQPYYEIVRTILRDSLTDAARHAVTFALTTM